MLTLVFSQNSPFFLGPVSRPPVGFGDNEDVREAYLSTDQLSETSGLPPPLVDNDLSFDHEKDLQLSLCPSKSCPEGLFDDSKGKCAYKAKYSWFCPS